MTTSSLIIWMLILTASVIGMLWSAALEIPAVFLATCGVVSLALAMLGIRERTALLASGASASRIGSVTAHSMGLIWIWGALSLFVTYVFILSWREWWQFLIAFAVVGAISLGYAWMLQRDADAGREDEMLLRLGRYLAIGQLVGMILVIIGLVVDPDKEFFRIREGDWAANIIFLLGAVALLILTAHALRFDRKPAS